MERALADEDLAESEAGIAVEVEESGMILLADGLGPGREMRSDEDGGDDAFTLLGEVLKFFEAGAHAAGTGVAADLAGEGVATAEDIELDQDFSAAAAGRGLALDGPELNAGDLPEERCDGLCGAKFKRVGSAIGFHQRLLS